MTVTNVPITREQVIRDIAKDVSLLFGLPLDSRDDVEAVVGEALPTFETIAAAHALTLSAEDTSIIRPRIVTAMRELGEEGIETIGIIVSYAGSTMDLLPDGDGWQAAEILDDLGDEPGESIGHGATPLEALKTCAAETKRLYGITDDGDPGHDAFGNDEPQLP